MEQAVPQQKQASPGKRILLILGGIVLAGWVLVMVVNLSSFESTALQGREAPDFSLALFDQFEQEQLVLSELRGQVVVINFWASWCVECYKEARLLEEAYQDFKDQGVVFLGVDYLDTEKEALAYMAQYGITYPSGQDFGTKISRDYMITGVPETFFIDQNGDIVHVQIGPIERPQLYQLLQRLVGGGSA
jgi:cytochrome c biogenesis protein CcmG/thiol:disulfide interchange protein DsbE